MKDKHKQKGLITDLDFSESLDISAEVNKKKTIVENNGTNVTSPIVGTVYLAPEPGAKKFVELGQKVKKGQTIMIVEAMKTMNHVPCTENGTCLLYTSPSTRDATLSRMTSSA